MQASTKKCAEKSVAFERILVAVDDGLSAEMALRTVSKLASTDDVQVALIHVLPSEVGVGVSFSAGADRERLEHRQLGHQVLVEAKETIGTGVRVVEEFLVEGDAAREIVNAARDWHADLLVVGTRGRGRLTEFVLGSTAEAVVRTAPCPVLVVNRCKCDHCEL